MKTIHKALFLIILLYSFLNGQTAVAPSAGDGSSGNPYQIATWQNLYWISQNSAQWNKYYIQTADINFGDADPAINTWASGAGWTPIGNTSTAFTGSYNGQNYCIIGLYINNASGVNLGLFGYITGNGSASISNLFIQGSITGSNSIAALVGNITSSNVSITNCHSNTTVTSTNTTSDGLANTGGLIGIVASGAPTITNCSSSGTVTGQGLRSVGGLIGYLNSGTVQKAFSTANVINSASNQGNTGGFIGGINSNGNNTLIEDCFATGNVSGGTNNNGTEWRNGIGGFIGTKRTEYSGYTKTIRNCYSTGVVSKTGISTDIGGFIGRFAENFAPSVSPTITNCYWDTQRSTQATSAGGAGTGLTTANMKVQGSFTSWDFTNTWKMSSSITYDGYPTLEWAKGYSTAPTSNQIAGLNNLVYVAENSIRWATSYTQTADINAWWTCGWDYQEGWTPIGNNTTKYTGTTYDGDNFEINHLFINRSTSDFQGFFGYTNGAEVKDLTIKNANISARSSLGALAGSGDNVTIRNCHVTGSISGIGASADFTGGVIGDSRGNSLIENSYANVTVSGHHDVGALVGRTLNDGSTSTVRYCYSKGTVTGTGSYIGGLVGQNNGSISNCFSQANVKGTGTKVGGLVGYHYFGTIDKCYSNGSVTGSSELGGLVGGTTSSTTTNSYWDTQTSGRATSVEGTGKTTAEMTTDAHNNINNIYIQAGWDFKGVGSEGLWNIKAEFNDGYPYLDWQYPDESPLPVELTSFAASVNENKVVLNWQTATEQNNHGFEVERSVVGGQNVEWKTIGFVDGNGNSNSPNNYSFKDNSPLSGLIKYRLKQIDNDGSFTYSESVEVEIENIPTEYVLFQNYPNPFNPSTTIKFGLPKDSKVVLEVYNIIGEKVTTLINQEIELGFHQIKFDAKNLTSGIYVYRIKAGDFVQSRKLLLIK